MNQNSLQNVLPSSQTPAPHSAVSVVVLEAPLDQLASLLGEQIKAARGVATDRGLRVTGTLGVLGEAATLELMTSRTP
jgi:predicted nucleic acid-binding protein